VQTRVLIAGPPTSPKSIPSRSSSARSVTRSTSSAQNSRAPTCEATRDGQTASELAPAILAVKDHVSDLLVVQNNAEARARRVGSSASMLVMEGRERQDPHRHLMRTKVGNEAVCARLTNTLLSGAAEYLPRGNPVPSGPTTPAEHQPCRPTSERGPAIMRQRPKSVCHNWTASLGRSLGWRRAARAQRAVTCFEVDVTIESGNVVKIT